MGTYQIPAPPPMSVKGDVAENWKDFENSWEYYVIATDLRSKLDNNQVHSHGSRLQTDLPSLSAADK